PGGRGEVAPRPLEAHLAAALLQATGDDLHQGRLAGAVVAEQSHDLATFDLEADTAQGLDGAEMLGDLLQAEQRCRFAHAASVPDCIIGSRGARSSSCANKTPKRGDRTPETASAAAPRRTALGPLADGNTRGALRLRRSAIEWGKGEAAFNRSFSISSAARPPMIIVSGSNRFSIAATALRNKGAASLIQPLRPILPWRRSSASSDR